MRADEAEDEGKIEYEEESDDSSRANDEDGSDHEVSFVFRHVIQ